LQVLERTVRLEQHAASRAMARQVYARVEELLRANESRNDVQRALLELYSQFREQGQAIQRDAVAEVLDALDQEQSEQLQ
jgi:hypothetical protein